MARDHEPASTVSSALLAAGVSHAPAWVVASVAADGWRWTRRTRPDRVGLPALHDLGVGTTVTLAEGRDRGGLPFVAAACVLRRRGGLRARGQDEQHERDAADARGHEGLNTAAARDAHVGPREVAS
jgi:hypothetical protein